MNLALVVGVRQSVEKRVALFRESHCVDLMLMFVPE